jgi:NTE family protein
MSKKRIGLALSGGGYRAAAFHIGTLKKLHELGILQKVSVLSTISGGSIAGAYFCLSEDFNLFEQKLYNKLATADIICEMLLSKKFLFTNLVLFLILVGAGLLSKYLLFSLLLSLPVLWYFFQFKILSLSPIIEKLYDEHFFKGVSLSGLRDSPVLAINATNLQTGRLFTFSKRKMDDSAYSRRDGKPIKFRNANFPLSRAVMASTCVPTFFSPVSIGKEYFEDAADCLLCNPVLVDGGIYDNQGIQKPTFPKSSYESDFIIASDAGTRIAYEKVYRNNFSLVKRSFDVFMQRIKHLQMIKNIYQPSVEGKDKCIAFLSLDWDLEGCIPGFVRALSEKNIHPDVIAWHAIPKHLVDDVDQFKDEISVILKKNVAYEEIFSRNLSRLELNRARAVKTNLQPIPKEDLDLLIKHAGNITELQVKLYCPQISLAINTHNP